MDSYIAASFWLHLLCLCLTGTIGKNRYEKTKKCRLAVAAALCAGLDAVAVVLTYDVEVEGPLLFLGIALAEMALGAGIAYGKQRLLPNGMRLLVVTALLAGFFQMIPIRNVGLFCLVGSVLLPILKTGAENVFRAKQTQQSIFNTWIFQNNQEKQMSAFMDTGNRLRLYGYRVPVVLVDEECLAEWIKEAETKMPQKLVFLPYKGVGGKGILRGVRVQCKISLQNGNVIGGEVAAVAAEHKLFDGCAYQMILQPEVLGFPVQKEMGPETVGYKKEEGMVCVKDTQEGENYVI